MTIAKRKKKVLGFWDWESKPLTCSCFVSFYLDVDFMIVSSIELCLFAVESNGFWFGCLWWIFHICTECIDNFAPNVFVHLFSKQYHPIPSSNQCYVIGHPLFCFGVLKQRTPESLWQCCSNLRKKTLLPKQINLPPNWPSCTKLYKNPLRLGQWYPLEDIEIFYKNSQAITCKGTR